ncbi:MAG: N4-gp56 family major capsid protein [Methanobrevibacter sp.]|uniref:N4-gp56 family major capsid protein n=1 Tax=Methanobrevibacter sp. TaxID=66852 RepID=UPI0031F58EED|nr:N4-gp56 family major capsid protein [Methanobrevibacter sp.]
MPDTMKSNIIIPEVMGEMINAKIEALAKLTPYAKVDTTLQGVPGDTKTVPSWNYIGDAEDVAEGEEVDVTNMTASSTTFTIKKAMKSVGITQESINSGLGNPIGQAETQLAKSINGKVDNDLIEATYTATMTSGDGSTKISYANIVDANSKFEDEEDGIEKVMFIHPIQEATILKDTDFVSADKFEAGVAVRGSIGKIAGTWIKKSKKVKLIKYAKDNSNGTITIVADEANETTSNKHLATIQPNCFETLVVGDKVKAVTNEYYLNPIIKMEPDSSETEYTEDELPALTIFLKADTTVDKEWFPKKQKTDVTACKYYGVALTNGAKVVLCKFKK